jgi:hypothetical protein
MVEIRPQQQKDLSRRFKKLKNGIIYNSKKLFLFAFYDRKVVKMLTNIHEHI